MANGVAAGLASGVVGIAGGPAFDQDDVTAGTAACAAVADAAVVAAGIGARAIAVAAVLAVLDDRGFATVAPRWGVAVTAALGGCDSGAVCIAQRCAVAAQWPRLWMTAARHDQHREDGNGGHRPKSSCS